MKVKTMLQNIISVLSNFTGRAINETTTMEEEACGAPRLAVAEEEDGEELSSGRERSASEREESTGQQSSSRSRSNPELGAPSIHQQTLVCEVTIRGPAS